MRSRSLEFNALINSIPGPFGMYGILLSRPSFSINNILFSDDHDIKKLKKHLNDTLKIEADYLIRHKRSFTIYKWSHDAPVWGYGWNQSFTQSMLSYIPFIKFSQGKFSKIVSDSVKPNKALMAMHLWLTDDQALHNWMGGYYERLIVDML
jgi:hypothetical protein